MAALLLAIQISPWYYSHGDGHAYISIARHIARGDGLRNMGSPVLWFPPGYPILISPLFLIRQFPLLEISIVQWFLAVALLVGIYRWARLRVGADAVWIAALGVGTNAVWIHYRRTVSEVAFMAVAAWLLVSLDALSQAASRRRFLGWLAAAIGLTIALCLIRSVGIALAAGGACALLAGAAQKTNRNPDASVVPGGVSPRWLAAAAVLIGVAAAATVGGFVLRERWAAQPLGAGTYLDPHADKSGAAILSHYGAWFALVTSDIGRIMVPFMLKCYGDIGAWWDVNMLVYVPVVLLLLYGYFRWLRCGADPLAWSLPFYLAVLTYFRWESGSRWWVPMTPALCVCLWHALEPSRAQRRSILCVLWLLHVLAAMLYWLGSDLPRTLIMNRSWPTARSLAAEITTGRDRVVIDDSSPLLADVGTLLTLSLDRYVRETSIHGPPPPSAQWYIIPDGEKPPPGFVPRSCVGGCQLLHRG